jgi:hypothetical protein
MRIDINPRSNEISPVAADATVVRMFLEIVYATHVLKVPTNKMKGPRNFVRPSLNYIERI